MVSSDPHYVIFRTAQPVPEPSSLLLVGAGLAVFVAVRKRLKRRL
ncbi:MAG: PEP-CTERM sorting domain-containing protein [Gammaproteobacteria bacterium]|nr:PEP-CTERM sorting domain-containing protein [Gammaproteobacteria bacterium]